MNLDSQSQLRYDPLDSKTYQEIKKGLRTSGLSVGKFMPAAVLAAFFFTILIPDLSPKYRSEMTITALDSKSENAKGSVVWLAFPSVKNLRDQGFQIRKSKGWEERNDLLISNQNQPAELQIAGRFSSARAFQFFTTPYSGKIKVEVGRINKVIDLFRTEPGKELMPITDYLPTENAALLPVMWTFLLGMARHLLITLVLCTGLEALTRILPRPLHGTNKYIIGATIAILFLLLAAFYPGVMYVDSYDQYAGALSFRFGDWHPPMMSVLWALTNKIIKGPGGMLILHLSTAVLSFCLLARVALMRGKKIYFAPMATMLAPVISCISFAVVKDVSFTFSLLLAFSVWYFWRAQGRLDKKRIAVILALLFYASAVRYNALPAIIPLVFLFLLDYAGARKSFFLAVPICILFAFVNYFICYKVLHASREYAYQVIMGHDLMGVYAISGRNYLSEDYIKKRDLDALMKRFDHRISDPTAFGGFPLHYEEQPISKLRKEWVAAIREQPSAYLFHRWILFKNFLTNFESTIFPMFPVSVPPTYNFSTPPHPLMRETNLGEYHTAFVTWVFNRYGFLFEARTYLLASIFLLILSFAWKSISAAALSLSSLIYLSSYFILAPGVHFRYIYWSVAATLLALITLWIEKESAFTSVR